MFQPPLQKTALAPANPTDDTQHQNVQHAKCFRKANSPHAPQQCVLCLLPGNSDTHNCRSITEPPPPNTVRVLRKKLGLPHPPAFAMLCYVHSGVRSAKLVAAASAADYPDVAFRPLYMMMSLPL